jgi:hypothetical protein
VFQSAQRNKHVLPGPTLALRLFWTTSYFISVFLVRFHTSSTFCQPHSAPVGQEKKHHFTLRGLIISDDVNHPYIIKRFEINRVMSNPILHIIKNNLPLIYFLRHFITTYTKVTVNPCIINSRNRDKILRSILRSVLIISSASLGSHRD